MGRRRRRKIKFRLEKATAQSVSSVILLLSSLLTFLSFFGQAAGLGSIIQDFLNRLFGWGVILVPFILGLAGLILLRTIRWSFVNLRTLTGLCLFTLSFLGLIHLFVPSDSAYSEALLGEGGGLTGFFFQLFLRNLFSPFGAFLVLAALFIISLLVIFNTSLDSVLAFLSRVGGEIQAFYRNFILQKKEPALTKEEEVEIPEEAPAPKPQEVSGKLEIISAAGQSKESMAYQEKVEAERKIAKKEEEFVPTELPVWEYPPLSLLSEQPVQEADRGDIKKNADLIEKTLASFGIEAKAAEVNLGPAVTQYALSLAEGTKLSRVVNLQNNIAMALAAPTGMVRIEAPIPGKSLVGVEVPNYAPSLVTLKSILTSEAMQNAKSKLTVALGHDVAGQPLIADVGKMPHVLVAGTTGSGKSVLMNSFLATLLFRCSPQELKLILVDTKRVEFSQYNDIPHLLHPVIVEPEEILAALKWAISEMDRRYKLLQNARAKNIDAFNELSGFQALPYVLIFVDELADLMAWAPGEVEKSICRLAQMARATGIHLVLATQRPSVDVLTGLIKANIPCRIAFQVASQVDSRVILDQGGAEKLLGRGDMLYLPPDQAKPLRIRGVFVSEKELNNLREFLRKSGIAPDYQEEVTEGVIEKGAAFEEPEDELFPEAVKTVCQYDRASASLLQRRLRIGYARAARLLDEMEKRGIVGPQDASHPREVLVTDPSQVL